ncbi:hypothetical protein ADICEAN_02296 [Cesiribacter andamanensis AMV16]|uniref:Secretion system C-terminal sorting domain-containing protein n=1 Tax=Cesiribacter andamanensis AMV16 TaxID=1279009 RepID=M7NVN8_9BACT|nr:hypothetical protein ADICEAN_02296 [Cesiribacter andamanensis AMV16]
MPGGNYYYDLRLINCTSNTLYRGTVTFFRPLLLTMSLYPNPAQDYVEVDLQQQEDSVAGPRPLPEDLQLAVVSLQGEMVLRREGIAFPMRLDVRALPEKEYVLLLRHGNRLERQRLLLRR